MRLYASGSLAGDRLGWNSSKLVALLRKFIPRFFWNIPSLEDNDNVVPISLSLVSTMTVLQQDYS